MKNKAMRTISLIGLLVFFICFSCDTKSRITGKYSSVPYTGGEEGYFCYRIPSLAITRNGVVLAFAEARKNDCNDTGDIDIVLKRSEDGGRTWSPLKVVWDDASNVCGNPCAVTDPETGRIILVACWNSGNMKEENARSGVLSWTRNVYVLYSDDEGITWTQPRNITESVKDVSWAWYATGPCHAIVKLQEPYQGRIIVPANHRDSANVINASHIIYSDDGGQHWAIGGILESGGNECSIAELNDGSLRLNMRNYNRDKGKCRALSYSNDGGHTWTPLVYAHDLIEPRCQGSILNYSVEGKTTNTLLFSNPADENKRINMTIKQSVDKGKTWEVACSVYDGPSAYSDLVNLPDGEIGILYENGKTDRYQRITFEVIPKKKFKK